MPKTDLTASRIEMLELAIANTHPDTGPFRQNVGLSRLLLSAAFRQFLNEPEGAFPIGFIPDQLQNLLPGKFIFLTEQAVHKMRSRHPDVIAGTYRKVQATIEYGHLLKDFKHGKPTIVFFGRAQRTFRWKVVIASAGSNFTRLVTFYKVTERSYQRAIRGVARNASSPL